MNQDIIENKSKIISTQSTEKQNKKGMSIKSKQAAIAWGFLTPSLLLFLIFTVIPFCLAIVFAFADYNGIEIKEWVGWDNFRKALNEEFFMSSIKNVFVFALFYVPLSIVSSLIISYLISQVRFKQNFFKILFYLPSLTSGVAMVFVWKSLLTSSDTINFLKDELAMVSIIAISVWSALGGNMLIYLSAMQTIPKSVYEAGSLDGASKVNQFLHITLPLLRPSTYFIFTTTLIGSFQLFDLVYLLTGGGNHSVVTPVIEIYLFAKQYKFGTGSAMSIILFIIIMIVTVITQAFVKEGGYDSRRRINRRAKQKE